MQREINNKQRGQMKGITKVEERWRPRHWSASPPENRGKKLEAETLLDPETRNLSQTQWPKQNYEHRGKTTTNEPNER
ncbi:hypothetical protein V6N11_017396 [Hibiscus sabdariffa]|uniref:Uncharacterized protein n=1 Tax=Hibiscus sabdariffa TaxID=183260 RepID=A0ABR2TYI5_9ROSI